MSEFVKSLVDYLINEYEKDAESPKETDVRFSVTIPASLNRRLKYCLGRVGKSRAGFATDTLTAVVMELEDRFGLLTPAPDGEEGHSWVQWYQNDVIMPPTEEDFRKEYGFRVTYGQGEGVRTIG